MSRLASHLKDKHFWIDNESYAFNYSVGKVVKISKMDSIFASRRLFKNPDLIKSKYLGKSFESFDINDFITGKINNDIGYISFNWFDKDIKKTDTEMAKILRPLHECQSLIIDIRNNIGGTDSSALTIANNFAAMDKCYQISRIRKSNVDFSYAEPKYWYTDHRNQAFIKPIIILINRYTMSAAEAFCLALKGQSHIIFMGEPTAGAFSDAEDAYLPNGWHFTYSIGVWTDCNEVLWEEKGIQPDVNLKNLSSECNESDLYLEQAISALSKN
jgi:C-terminal processing protease CtpA/Prc